MTSFVTPYGDASKKRILGKGIVVFIVKGKTYTYLSKELNNQIPRSLRQYAGWYPKKYSYIIPICLPEFFTKKEIELARNYYQKTFPHMYEEFIGTTVKVIPTKHTSPERHREYFYVKHRYSFIEITAWSDEENVPEGYVLIEAALGGDINYGERTYFLVPIQEYLNNTTEYGFICIPGVHQEQELI